MLDSPARVRMGDWRMASMTDRPPRRTQGFLPRLRRYRRAGTIPVFGAALDPHQPCRALKAHRCGCSWRRPLDHWHSHDRRRLRRQPASRRAAIHDRKTQAAYAALVRSALALVCRGSQQGGWTVSQVVKRKPRHESGVPWRPTADLALMCRLRVARAAAF
jgi:hypothetical protein